MKIALIGAFASGEGYLGMDNALQKLGIQTHFIGPMARTDYYIHERKMNYQEAIAAFNKELPDMIKESGADAILLWKGERVFPVTVRKIKDLGVKILYYSWDDPFYISNPKHAINTIQSCPMFDAAFTSCADSIIAYKKYGCLNTHLLWPGFDPAVHKPAIYASEEEKKDFESDVSFVATNTYHPRFYPQTTGNRIDMVHALMHNGVNPALWGPADTGYSWLHPVYGDPSLRPLYKRQVKFEESHKVFTGSKVNLNSHPIWGNLYFNERNFQILGSGSFMLCDAVTGIEKVLVPGVHIDIYHTLDDLVQKVKYYLANPSVRYSIAARGMLEAHQNHTWLHRAQVFVTEINKLWK